MDVIINADDLGISQIVNDSIFELIEDKLVTSSTIIANGPNFEDACQRARNVSQCSFGVHLNLTEFRPITGPNLLEPLLDHEGRFVDANILGVRADSLLKDGILREFMAQIEAVSGLGIPVSHIDSHYHVHTIPWMFPVLKKLQRLCNIRKVRIRGVFGESRNTRLTRRAFTNLYNFALRHYYQTATVQTFLNFETFHDRLSDNTINAKSVEVMVHPGSDTHNHAAEINLLKQPWPNWDGRIRLINYKELTR